MDDARPKCDLLRESRPPNPGHIREKLPFLNFDVPILAGHVPYPRDPRSDRERTMRRVDSAQIIPQAVLDLSAVITASAARQQNPGECQRNAQEAQPNTKRPLEPHRPLPGRVRHHKDDLTGEVTQNFAA
jgi:hypothetical protein